MATPHTDTEALQKLIVRVVAVNPAGRNLILIGGFRYRYLDNSGRVSRDIDYHWDGDLAAKQAELVGLFKRALLPEARRHLGYDGSAEPASGPDADSPVVRIVNLAFWKKGLPGRIEIPVEITKIVKFDAPVQVVKAGTLYPAASAKDMIESKVVALLNRTHLKHRDFVDIFLFQEELSDDSFRRLKKKFSELGIKPERVRERVSDFADHRDYHAQAIQAVIDEYCDKVVLENINDAGGGEMILDAVMGLLKSYVPHAEGERNHEGV